MAACVAWALALAPVSASEALLRDTIGEVALRQVRRMDPAWQPAQRDCAGLVRYAYRTAFSRWQPQRVNAGLWHSADPEAHDFADAENLLTYNFTPLGRDDAAYHALRTGDILAFRQMRGDAHDAVFHVMLAVVPASSADEAWLVYHPGEARAAVRAGKLRIYAQQAPREWQPVATNPAFLGYFRFKDWSHGNFRP